MPRKSKPQLPILPTLPAGLIDLFDVNANPKLTPLPHFSPIEI